MADLVDLEDEAGNRVTITAAHYRRYPQIAERFRPVSEKKKTTPVVAEPPTGDENEEN